MVCNYSWAVGSARNVKRGRDARRMRGERTASVHSRATERRPMISEAQTIEDCLAELPPARRDALTSLCEMIAEFVSDARELMKYGHPHWELHGSHFALASQKRHMALYVAEREVMARYRARLRSLKGVDAAASRVRFGRLENLPCELVRSLLEEAVRVRRGRAAGRS